MGNKKKVVFIVNPFSGVHRKHNIAALLEQHLDSSKYDYEVCFTERIGHATVLAKEAVENGSDMVVAVGGDGSVNEVSKILIGTDIILGILPGGSGNGFATYLGLGRNIKKAIHILNEGKIRKVDTCVVNQKPFVNLAGVGLDAAITIRLKNSTLRGFLGYLKYALQEIWNYKAKNYEITIDGKTIKTAAMFVEVANAQMFGYNFHIAPQAKLDDGVLDLVIVKDVPKWRFLFMLRQVFNKTLNKSRFIECYTGKKISIQSTEEMPVHIDGESFHEINKLEFSILPLSLNVWVK